MSRHMEQRCLAKTQGNVDVQLVTLTSKHSPQSAPPKQVIFIIARQHPAETTASYVLDGIIRGIIQQPHCPPHPSSPAPLSPSQYLLQHYIFMIVPIVNPDGVILGNCRCSLEGVDINRRWNSQQGAQEVPQVQAIRNLIQKVQTTHHIAFFLDLHGHSKKYSSFMKLGRLNSFIYGCSSKEQPERSCLNKVFPKILNQHSPYFSLENSKFNIDVSKENTARACMWRLLRDTPNVFTIETSYFGYRDSHHHNAFVQFNPSNLTNYGTNILESLVHYHHFLVYLADYLQSHPSTHSPALAQHLQLPLPSAPHPDTAPAFYLKLIHEFEEELANKIILLEGQTVSESESEKQLNASLSKVPLHDQSSLSKRSRSAEISSNRKHNKSLNKPPPQRSTAKEFPRQNNFVTLFQPSKH